MAVRALAVSDVVDDRIYSSTLRQRMADVQIVFGCGDLPARYLEFLADALEKPVYYVLGNHAEELTRKGEFGKYYQPLGCIDLGFRVVRDSSTGLIVAGLPGSPRYNGREPEQYTEWEMAARMLRMVPKLIWNRWRHGRALDVLITHAPPRDVNDASDYAHRGFIIMRRFLRWFTPRYQLHGHIHLYDNSVSRQAQFVDTQVINVYPYQTLDIEGHETGEPATDAGRERSLAITPGGNLVRTPPTLITSSTTPPSNRKSTGW